LVCDVDSLEADRLAMSLGLCAEPTLTAQTGRRYLAEWHQKYYGEARHLYYTTSLPPEGVLRELGNPKIGGVLEVKAGAGYVVLSPSVHPDSGARYEWHEVIEPIALPPKAIEALKELCARSRSRAPAVTHASILEGRRTTTLLSYAGAMRRIAMSREAIEAALLLENMARCQPPLEEADISRIVRGIQRYPGGDVAGGRLALTRVPEGAEGDARVTETAALPVLVALGRYANRDTHLAWPSAKTLAKRCEVSPRTVQRALKLLALLGFIGRVSGSPGRTIQYKLLSDPAPRTLQRIRTVIVSLETWHTLARRAFYPPPVIWRLAALRSRLLIYDTAMSQVDGRTSEPAKVGSVSAPLDLRHQSVTLTVLLGEGGERGDEGRAVEGRSGGSAQSKGVGRRSGAQRWKVAS